VSKGRGNRTTRKVHAPAREVRLDGDDFPEHVTTCGQPQRRRYVRLVTGRPNVGAFTGEPVNCSACLAALRAHLPDEYLAVAGIPMLSVRNNLPILLCSRCDDWDEQTSESQAHGICASCMHQLNKPEAP
jgi:hypothetical protein